jgi:hypothetical protein
MDNGKTTEERSDVLEAMTPAKTRSPPEQWIPETSEQVDKFNDLFLDPQLVQTTKNTVRAWMDRPRVFSISAYRAAAIAKKGSKISRKTLDKELDARKTAYLRHIDNVKNYHAKCFNAIKKELCKAGKVLAESVILQEQADACDNEDTRENV